MAIFLLVACKDSSVDKPGLNNPATIEHDFVAKEELPAIPSPSEPTEFEKQQTGVREDLLPDLAKEEPTKETAVEEIEWGQEINLAEMIVKAKGGEIREIQWHVLPNILRAEAADNQIFHLRNENRGVDLRNTLIGEGVKIGNEGVIFRHVF